MSMVRSLAPKRRESVPANDASQMSPITQPRTSSEGPMESIVENPSPLETSNHTFNKDMSPTHKRKRRTFADSEKERIKHVRKHGACLECKVKKRKCVHVPDATDDRPSPSTESQGSEPHTPGTDSAISREDAAQKPVPAKFDYEAFLTPEVL